MVRYSVLDENDNEFQFDENTFRLLDDSLKVETDIIEKSFTAGGFFAGIQRAKSKTLSFQYDINKVSNDLFRNRQNNLLEIFHKARILRDNTNKIETQIVIEGHSIGYDDGGYFRGASNTIEFTQLIPYWYDIDYTQKTVSIGTDGIGSVKIENQGNLETPSVITIDTDNLCDDMFLYIQETLDGIRILDDQFGLNELNRYIIDNEEGISEIGQSGSPNGIDRKNKIVNGTGFFNFQVGVNTLIFIMSSTVEIIIKWKNRYYV